MATLTRINVNLGRSCIFRLRNSQILCRCDNIVRFISSSKDNKDVASATQSSGDLLKYKVVFPSEAEAKKISEKYKEEAKTDWVTYGFHYKDKAKDRTYAKIALFGGITLMLCWGGFFYMYHPDPRMSEWNKREAYLELARRESLGLPTIDPFVVPESKIALPTEDELGDLEIIV